MRDHGRAAGDAQRGHAFRRAAARMPRGGVYHRAGYPEHDPQHPQRPRAAAAARQGLSLFGRGEDRLPDSRLRTHGRRDLRNAEPVARRHLFQDPDGKQSGSIEEIVQWNGADGRPQTDRDFPRHPGRGPWQGDDPPRRRRPGGRGTAAHRRVPRLRAVHPRPPDVGSAGHRAAALRHLPGQPPPCRGQGDGPDRGGRHPAAHGGEDASPDALRADHAEPCAALFSPLCTGYPVRIRRRLSKTQYL
jgi:hypothetical protein